MNGSSKVIELESKIKSLRANKSELENSSLSYIFKSNNFSQDKLKSVTEAFYLNSQIDEKNENLQRFAFNFFIGKRSY